MNQNLKEIICQGCKKLIGYNYLESVWEENDNKTYELIHPICVECGKQVR